MAMPREKEFEGYILDGMARALWVHAYMIWAIEVDPPPYPPSGGEDVDWETLAPNTASTRSASTKAANALASLYGQVNDLREYPLAAMFAKVSAGWDANRAYAFGGELALMALGTLDPESGTLILPRGRTRTAYHWEPVIPNFTVDLDDSGTDLSWDGGLSWPTRQANPPRRRAPRTAADEDEVSEADLDRLADAGRVIHPSTVALTPVIAERLLAFKTSMEGVLSPEALERLSARLHYSFRTGMLDTQTATMLDMIMEPMEPNPAPNWPGSRVQSLVFDQAQFSVKRAKAWAEAHGYHHAYVDTTAHSYRIRQFEAIPGLPCRTVRFAPGIQAVICATRNPCCDAHANPGKTVLLIEDEAGMQRATTRMIKKIYPDATVLVADNYAAAVSELETHDVALVISDVNIAGDRTGLDVFEWVKENRPNLVDHYVFFTGGNPQVERLHYRYLEKPATVDEMRAMISKPVPGR